MAMRAREYTQQGESCSRQGPPLPESCPALLLRTLTKPGDRITPSSSALDSQRTLPTHNINVILSLKRPPTAERARNTRGVAAYFWERHEMKVRFVPRIRHVFVPAVGPQRMKNNQAAASQSALRTTRHGAGPHGHPPGPSAAHLHGESVTGHPAVSGSELSIKGRGAWLTRVWE